METKFDDQFFYYADKYNLDFSLVKGIAMTESSLDPYAIRYEPHYEYITPAREIVRLARINGIDAKTEKNLQMCSLGLMQIMGANVRVYGYSDNLTALFDDHSLSIQYGCKHLSILFKKYRLKDDVISAYNRGSVLKKDREYVNQLYVTKVKENIKKIESI